MDENKMGEYMNCDICLTCPPYLLPTLFTLSLLTVLPCPLSSTSVFPSSPSPHCSLPGVKKPLGQYGPAGVEDKTAADSKDDDDDMDLFGSDEEVTASCFEFNQTLLILSG